MWYIYIYIYVYIKNCNGILVGALGTFELFFAEAVGNHYPNRRFLIFFRCVGIPPTSCLDVSLVVENDRNASF